MQFNFANVAIIQLVFNCFSSFDNVAIWSQLLLAPSGLQRLSFRMFASISIAWHLISIRL